MAKLEDIEHGRQLLLRIGGNCEEYWQQSDSTTEHATDLAEALARVVGRPEYDDDSGEYVYPNAVEQACAVPAVAGQDRAARVQAIKAELLADPTMMAAVGISIYVHGLKESEKTEAGKAQAEAEGPSQSHRDAALAALAGIEFKTPPDYGWALASVAQAIAAAERGAGWYTVDGTELVNRLTDAMRAADRAFERVGGSTRHHVRDCLIPELEEAGLKVVALPPPPASPLPAGEEGR